MKEVETRPAKAPEKQTSNEVARREKDGDTRQPIMRKQLSVAAVVPDERRRRRKRTGRGGLTGLAEVQQWEAERVVRYVTD